MSWNKSLNVKSCIVLFCQNPTSQFAHFLYSKKDSLSSCCLVVSFSRLFPFAISRICKNRKKEDFLLSVNILFADELGQLSAEELSLYDIILRHVRKSTVFMGGVLIIGTLDHLQIQPINGRPFLTANCIIPCFKMVSLRHSVRATGSQYVELQSLVRKDYIEFETKPELLHRFRNICSDIFTFVDNWDSEKITPHTFRVFSKKLPAKRAVEDFQNRMITRYENENKPLKMRPSVDIQKSRFSHDWKKADSETVNLLNQKCREPTLLIFEVGLIYLCTFNDEKKSNSQKAILFELPDQVALETFAPIKVLLAPPGCKDVSYVEGATKESYLQRGFTEIGVDCAPNKIYKLPNLLQGARKQYGLRHYVAGTNHSIMGDTLPSIATTISNVDTNYSMWDKGQLLVIISRTKKAEDTIFVGDKNATLDALESLLKHRTQWTDHMEQILKVVTINNDNSDEIHNSNDNGMTYSAFPFRPTDIILPSDCSGFVYMLISLRSEDFFYIGKTKDLNQRLKSHQSGYGSYSTMPEHLRPYAYYAYLCGFNGDKSLMFYIERQWKERVNRMKRNGINDPRVWAHNGGNEMLNLNLNNFGIQNARSELCLVLLFK